MPGAKRAVLHSDGPQMGGKEEAVGERGLLGGGGVSLVCTDSGSLDRDNLEGRWGERWEEGRQGRAGLRTLLSLVCV